MGDNLMGVFMRLLILSLIFIGCTPAFATRFTPPASITAPMLGTNVISGQTEDTSPDVAADYVLTFDASANANKKVLLSKLQTQTVVTTGTSYTATTESLIITTGSLTVTLPSASSSSKEIKIQKGDATLSNIVTISRAGSDQLVNGANTSATSTTLNTAGENLTLAPSGTLWYYRRNIPATVTSCGTNVIGATTTAPTKPGMTTDSVEMTRAGCFAWFHHRLAAMSGSTGTAGSGDYLLQIGGGSCNSLAADTTVTPVDTAVWGSTPAHGKSALMTIPGSYYVTVGAGFLDDAVLYSSTQYRINQDISGGTRNAYWSSGGAGFGNTSFNSSWGVRIPINGWKCD